MIKEGVSRMSDLISRQAAIDALEEQLDYLQMLNKDENPKAESVWYGVSWARNTIAELPSAQRKGKWIYLNGLDAFECSVCGRQMVRNIFDYCPWCGAEMTKGENDE